MKRYGRRPNSVRALLPAEVLLRQMELMQAFQRQPKGHRWESLLKRSMLAAGIFAAGIGIGRLIG